MDLMIEATLCASEGMASSAIAYLYIYHTDWSAQRSSPQQAAV